jgi:queuine tRNA-ribosyltransferase
MPRGFGFDVVSRSSRSKARLGLLRTAHGVVETPAIVPVATQGAIKALPWEPVKAAGTQLVISNTLHLHLRPGAAVVKKHGGLHAFTGWDRPIFTDSGGYQVFSLGFGKEMGTGKVAKDGTAAVAAGAKPKGLKITEKGVEFRSYLDGSRLFIGPEESMATQRDLGADVVFAFDECPPPNADRAYMETSMARTHRWARRCRDFRLAPHQALYGVVQGGGFKDLRKQSARELAAMGFDGFGIGGEFGASTRAMTAMLAATVAELPDDKPRHLLGIGHPKDIIPVIKSGVDTFDCTVPTHYARHGVAFVPSGRLDLMKAKFLSDKKPIDPKCECATCKAHSRAYLCHLFRSREINALSLVTQHNLHYFNRTVAEARELIKKGLL